MSKTVIVLLAVFVSGPADADRTFGGPCGDGSPYDFSVQRHSDSDWSSRNDHFGEPSYGVSSMVSRGGYRAPSYGASIIPMTTSEPIS